MVEPPFGSPSRSSAVLELPATLELPDVQALFHGEGEFVEVAAREPSFAGFFFEGDRLVALTTHLSRGEDVERAVRRTSPFTDALARSWTVEVRSADYSFNQLASWRNRLFRVVMDLPDVATLDLSESRNRVAIGLDTGSGEAAVWAAVEGAGVPLEAVIVEVTGRAVPSPGLRDRVRPLQGGLRTISKGTSDPEDPFYPAYVGACSYGFNAVITQTLDTVFITASHCTREMFKLDITPEPFYQTFYDSEPSNIGVELRDPPGLGSPPCGSTSCRRSDAAAILLSVDSVALGFIARTEWAGTWTDTGSIVIDDSNPAFEIVGRQTWLYEGLDVEKMGQRTGWTAGDVDKTCFASSHNPPGDDEYGNPNSYEVLCVYRARYMADKGDSGGPVFVRASPTSASVYLAGLHYANQKEWWETTYRGVFSTIQGIEWDLGHLQVTAEPSQLNLSIGGPEEVRADEWCAWNAAASGGNKPYTYDWYGALTGSNPYVQGFVTQSAWLYVDVTSQDLQQVTDSIWIEVDEQAPDCEDRQ